MIEQICAFIHNFFVANRYRGTFQIQGGTIDLPQLVGGQYFRIVGSRLNDGVYTYPPSDLADETFDGVVYDMRPPKLFLTLCSDVEAWQEKYGEQAESPYQSESFGGYSYTKASGANANGTTAAAGWQSAFKARLNEWRKLA